MGMGVAPPGPVRRGLTSFAHTSCSKLNQSAVAQLSTAERVAWAPYCS